MDHTPVSPTLDREAAVNVKRWPLILVAAMFLAGVAPAFLTRPTVAPRPAPLPPAAASAAPCTSTPAASTNAATQTESQRPPVNTHGSC